MLADTELDREPHGAMRIECVVNGPIQTNTYFAISGDEAVVIDPASEGERLARDFIDGHPGVRIVAIACTHGHADHVGGVAGMRRVLGEDVPFLMSEADISIVPGAIRHLRGFYGLDTEEPPVPNRTLTEGDTLAFGDVELQVLDAPGHTPGGIVLFAATEEGDLAFTGDTLFPGGHGRTDLEGGDDATIMRTLERLFTVLPEDTLCLIGHNGTTTVAQELCANPFVREALRAHAS